MTSLKLTVLGTFLPLTLTSCVPARDIIVVLKNGQPVVDFPSSIWRLVGLQNRTYCISRVEVFDSKAVLWSLGVPSDEPVYRSCINVKMPLQLGSPHAGFVSQGRPQFRAGQHYGVGIYGTGYGRVDFVFRPVGLTNITEPERQMEPPCSSEFNACGMVESSKG